MSWLSNFIPPRLTICRRSSPRPARPTCLWSSWRSPLPRSVGFGVFFFRLHTLPERVAHRGHKIQFEIVAILGLIALFTHMHIFWVAGLLLAFIDSPDFGGYLAGSQAVEKIAGVKPGEGDDAVPGRRQRDPLTEAGQAEASVFFHAAKPPRVVDRQEGA